MLGVKLLLLGILLFFIGRGIVRVFGAPMYRMGHQTFHVPNRADNIGVVIVCIGVLLFIVGAIMAIFSL